MERDGEYDQSFIDARADAEERDARIERYDRSVKDDIADLRAQLKEMESRLIQLTVERTSSKADKENSIYKEASIATVDAILDFTVTMGNSTEDPTVDAPTDWIEVAIDGTTIYLPGYVA